MSGVELFHRRNFSCSACKAASIHRVPECVGCASLRFMHNPKNTRDREERARTLRTHIAREEIQKKNNGVDDEPKRVIHTTLPRHLLLGRDGQRAQEEEPDLTIFSAQQRIEHVRSSGLERRGQRKSRCSGWILKGHVDCCGYTSVHQRNLVNNRQLPD